MRWAPRIAEGSLYVLLLLLPFSKAAIEIAFPFLLGGWALTRLQAGWSSSAWRTTAGRWCLAALMGYLAVCALSILTSTYPDHSLRGFVRKTLEYALFFVAAADVARAPGVAARCVRLLLVSSGLVCLDAIVQELTHWELLRGRLPALTYHRMTGPYENPIDLATYLAVIVPILIVQLRLQPRSRRWWLWGLLAVLLGCLIRVESQGAWLSLVVGLGVVALLERRLRAVTVGLGAALVAGASLYLQLVGRLGHTIAFHDLGTRDRWFMWQSAWRMIQDRPWLGQGLNTFMANYLRYWVGGEQQPRYAHNCFLQIAAETGVIGLAAFLVFLGVMLWLWWRAIRLAPADSPTRMIILGIGAAMAGFLAQSFFDTNLYALRQAALFWTLAGMATGIAVAPPLRPH